MEKVWRGAFYPDIMKHRDFHHSSYASHAAVTVRDEPVDVIIDPITENEFEEPESYYIAEVNWPGDAYETRTYKYLIPEGKEGKPNQQEVSAALKEYAKHPLPYPRDIEDYIVGGQEVDGFDDL